MYEIRILMALLKHMFHCTCVVCTCDKRQMFSELNVSCDLLRGKNVVIINHMCYQHKTNVNKRG